MWQLATHPDVLNASVWRKDLPKLGAKIIVTVSFFLAAKTPMILVVILKNVFVVIALSGLENFRLGFSTM